MPSVSPGRYEYIVASAIPGGQWMPESNQSMSDHLADLIRTHIAVASGPTPTNPLTDLGTEDSGVTLFIQFEEDLSGSDETLLGTLVARAADYFIVTEDDGVTDLGNPATITKPAGLLSSTVVTLQMKRGDGVSINGYGDDVTLSPVGIMPISTTDGEFGGTGKHVFTIGASLDRGTCVVEITGGTLPPRTLIAKWS